MNELKAKKIFILYFTLSYTRNYLIFKTQNKLSIRFLSFEPVFLSKKNFRKYIYLIFSQLEINLARVRSSLF